MYFFESGTDIARLFKGIEYFVFVPKYMYGQQQPHLMFF